MSGAKEGLPCNHEGEYGSEQDGRYFTRGQWSECYSAPIGWHKWHWGNYYSYDIGVVTLDDGTFLAGTARHVKDDSWSGGKSGGTFTYSRRFPTRDAAIRANAAEIIRMIRRGFRWKPGPEIWQRSRPWHSAMPLDVANEVIAWALAIAGRPPRQLYVAPPPPPKRVWHGKRLAVGSKAKAISAEPMPDAPIAAR